MQLAAGRRNKHVQARAGRKKAGEKPIQGAKRAHNHRRFSRCRLRLRWHQAPPTQSRVTSHPRTQSSLKCHPPVKSISPLGYWRKVKRSPTQTTENLTALSLPGTATYSAGPDRIYTYESTCHQLAGAQGKVFIRFLTEEIRFSLKSVFMVDARFELTTSSSNLCDDAIC